MTTDSAELTFVRCPSCRSLVPAVSTRCRMCGASLEAMSSDVPAPMAERRQEARLAQGDETVVAPTIAPVSQSSGPETAVLVQEQPMAEEMEIGEVAPVIAAAPELEDPLGVYLAKTSATEAVADRVVGGPVDLQVIPGATAVQSVPQSTEIRRESVSMSEQRPGATDIQSTNGARGHSARAGTIDGNTVVRIDNRRSAEVGTAEPELVRRSERVSGRLFGWLVSYAQSEGSSIELREGKFFVTGSSLKPSDLVVHDKSISTPHALVTVSVEQGLVVQDLMSDRGVFVRRGSRGAYQRYEETVQVQHRDWIRFGDVEFLVSIIAHPGEK